MSNKNTALKCDICGKFRKISELKSIIESVDSDYSFEDIYVICKICERLNK
jgi:hypothetical protein